jgi:hypothetical protein
LTQKTRTRRNAVSAGARNTEDKRPDGPQIKLNRYPLLLLSADEVT